MGKNEFDDKGLECALKRLKVEALDKSARGLLAGFGGLLALLGGPGQIRYDSRFLKAGGSLLTMVFSRVGPLH